MLWVYNGPRRYYSWSKTCDLSDDVMKLQFLSLNISKTKRWFIVTKLSVMSRYRMSLGVLQICDLENDGTNCIVVIKAAYFHTVHRLSRHIE